MKKTQSEDELSRKLIGLAFEAYNSVGAGFAEKIYQNIYEELLNEAGFSFKREVYADIKFGNKIVGSYRLDFLVEEKVIVEIKRRNEIFDKDVHQVLNYLNFYHYGLGLIFCFTIKGVKIKRLVV